MYARIYCSTEYGKYTQVHLLCTHIDNADNGIFLNNIRTFRAWESVFKTKKVTNFVSIDHNKHKHYIGKKITDQSSDVYFKFLKLRNKVWERRIYIYHIPV